MIELLKQQISGLPDREAKTNRARELLQLLFLKILQDKGYFRNMSFTGGTALRVLYDMRRFSEDLDFSVIDKKGYDFADIISVMQRELRLNGLNTSVKTKIKNTVQSCMLKFPGLLKATGISPLESENLSIKIEADSNPPAGGEIDNTLVNKMYVLNITHFALSSMYATKLHACFFRTYIKGRDFYDLLWYLGKKIKPNYTLLNNAIKQTQTTSYDVSEANIKGLLLKRVADVDFNLVKQDVERFLEDKNELKLLEADIIFKGISDVF